MITVSGIWYYIYGEWHKSELKIYLFVLSESKYNS